MAHKQNKPQLSIEGSKHIVDRWMERHASEGRSVFDLETMIEDGYEKIKEIGNGKYFIYSRSRHYGVVVAFYPPTKFKMITVFPKYNKAVNDDTQTVYVESKKSGATCSEKCAEYLTSLIENVEHVIESSKKNRVATSYIINEDEKIACLFVNGKFADLRYKMIEVK
jgi:hypothetical protein